MTGTQPPAAPAEAATTHERTMTEAVAANVSRLRRNSGWDLERLAAISGVNAAQLAAIEAGRQTPRVRTLWALAAAFEVPFGVLLAGVPYTTTTFHVLRAAESRIVDSAGGGFRSRPLSAAGDPREPEVYEVTLAPGWREDATPHARDTFEHIVVVRGVVVVCAGASEATLAAGDVVFFRADQSHVYRNPGTVEALLHLTMTYAGDWTDVAVGD